MARSMSGRKARGNLLQACRGSGQVGNEQKQETQRVSAPKKLGRTADWEAGEGYSRGMVEDGNRA